MFLPGDPVPSFFVRGFSNPNYSFDSVAGRYVVMTFIGGTRLPGMAAFVEQLFQNAKPFDDDFASAFIVSHDRQDEIDGRLHERYPGVRVFWDDDRKLAAMFGCIRNGAAGHDHMALQTWVLDPALRVLTVIPIENPATHFDAICTYLAGLQSPREIDSFAPVLVVPNVLEPELCREYIEYCRTVGAEDSGYMKTDPETGKTVLVVNYDHKRRADCTIEDKRLKDALAARIQRRLAPQIQRAFQFAATRMEGYLIATYDAEIGGYFRPHKDNTTLGTAHRRFAVSINLNAEEYDGGDLRFPEFGPRTYRPPTGGAVVFSCSLLHEATPVTRGTRYCILPFLYDDAAAAIRLKNAKHFADGQLRRDAATSVSPVPVKAQGKKNRALRFR